MRRLHPATIITAFLPHLAQVARNIFPALVMASFSSRDSMIEVFIGLLGVLTGLGSISTYLTTRFGIEEGKFVLRHGWLYRKERTILLDRIQNVNLRQGLLERLFGAWRVDIETAAGTGAEITLNVVSREEAERLRLELTPQGATAPAPDEPDLYRASRNEILWASATENHALQIFLMAALNVPVLTVIALNLPIGRHLVRESDLWWVVVARVPFPYLSVAALCLSSALLSAGWLWGIARLYVTLHGFSLRSGDGVFRIRKGLFTRMENVVPARRVRVLELKEPWLQRQIGLCSLHAYSAGGYGEKLTPSAALAPVLLWRDAERFARLVWPNARLDGLARAPPHRDA